MSVGSLSRIGYQYRLKSKDCVVFNLKLLELAYLMLKSEIISVKNKRGTI
jgi:hypothetical protein